ncbi:MAG: cell division protein ZipA [Dokdonella sp.]
MDQAPALSPTELRILIGAIGAVLLLLIYLFGRPRKPGQGKRIDRNADGERVEPTLGSNDGDAADEFGDGEPSQAEFEIGSDDDESPADGDSVRREPRSRAGASRRSTIGVRPAGEIERIVTLYVSARSSSTISGSELVVAAEKAGLEFGDRNIFHRMVAGKFDLGPIFSMATMTKPGSFDMAHIEQLATPGVTLFMTLPGPLPALDAWDTMLPTAQRLAELLNGAVLDEQRNALGRQRVAHLRDELRAWDRKRESSQIRPNW